MTRKPAAPGHLPEARIPADLETLLMEDADWGGAAVPPIFQTSLFSFPSVAALEDAMRNPRAKPLYTRGLNPTVSAFEDKVARLERAEAALAFASGMGAIANALLGLLGSGDRIVAVTNIYSDTYRLMIGLLARMGVETTFADGRDPAAVAKAAAGAKLVYLESPTSLVFDTLDLPQLIAVAHEAGALAVVDNSWATPLLQRPLESGADLVAHSASKYLSGHSDTVAGVLAGSAQTIGRITERAYPSLGAKMAPFEAWLLLRGMRTLPTRMRRHHTSGLLIAQRLAEHPAVSAVHHPGLAAQPAAGLHGYAGLFSFRLREGAAAARALCDRLKRFRLAVSWGGFESLALPLCAGLGRSDPRDPFAFFEVPEDMVRISVGLEDPEMLWEDMAAALAGQAPSG